MTNSNNNLHKAKKAQNDEFYTQIVDIERELLQYNEKYFENKTIFLNCDDPTESHFWRFFALNFEELGIKKLIATHYDVNKPTYKLELLEYNGKPIKTKLKQNGDFRSSECIEILKTADLVVTNPPFSLFREYVAQLIKYDKKFIILGNMNSLFHKEIFKLIIKNQIWLGNNKKMGGMKFEVPKKYSLDDGITGIFEENGRLWKKFGNISWYTNLLIKRLKELKLSDQYKGNEVKYPKYDNYDAINIDKVVEIPVDYEGVMGVPITFMGKYDPKQFKIIDGLNRYTILDVAGLNANAIKKHLHMTEINGKAKYSRILIKNRKPIKEL